MDEDASGYDESCVVEGRCLRAENCRRELQKRQINAAVAAATLHKRYDTRQDYNEEENYRMEFIVATWSTT